MNEWLAWVLHPLLLGRFGWTRPLSVIIKCNQESVLREADGKGTEPPFSQLHQDCYFFWAQKSQEKNYPLPLRSLTGKRCRNPHKSSLILKLLYAVIKPTMNTSCKRCLYSPEISKAKVISLRSILESLSQLKKHGIMDECLFFNWSHCEIKYFMPNADITETENVSHLPVKKM